MKQRYLFSGLLMVALLLAALLWISNKQSIEEDSPQTIPAEKARSEKTKESINQELHSAPQVESFEFTASIEENVYKQHMSFFQENWRFPEIMHKKLNSWLEEKESDGTASSEDYAVVADLNNDVERLRTAIELDPWNKSILYQATSHSRLSLEEKLTYSQRLYEVDSDNSLASYIYAARLMQAGDRDTAFDVLEHSIDQKDFNSFKFETQLSVEDALLEIEYHPTIAKFASITMRRTPYL
ncbi:MAG: hypothetical protein AAGH40_05160, partial [Verrucomicrobiota bacterium]